MNPLLSEIDSQISGLAWSLWNTLGVAGVDHFHDSCLIQLEELILMTTMVSHTDHRLRNEALDWLSKYHESCSVSRLKTLLDYLSTDDKLYFFQFARTLNSLSTAKWPVGEESSQFKTKLSGKTVPPKLAEPSLLNLRLRYLFSPGVKADVLTQLLTKSKNTFSSSDLVEIGYSKRSIMTALDDFAASGFLNSINVRNQKNYEIKQPKELQVVLGKLPKTAPPWNKILQAIVIIRSTLPQLENASEITRGIVFRNCLQKIEPLLPGFISPLLNSSPDFQKDWRAIIEVINAIRQGNFYMQYQVFDEFEKIVIDILRHLYQVDDCVDGIETIESQLALEQKRHLEIYKECYQLFLSFSNDVEKGLRQFLQYPFHKIMDETLSELTYRFSQEKLPLFLQAIKQIKTIDQINNPQQAIFQYKQFIPSLMVLRQFLNTFRKQLQELYFINTKVYLLTLPDVLYKRHQVRDLFLKQ